MVLNNKFQFQHKLQGEHIMQIIYRLTKILFYSNIGVFIGRALYEVFWYRTHPDIYVMTSAPWYTNILVYGIFAALIAGVLGVVLLILKKIINKQS